MRTTILTLTLLLTVSAAGASPVVDWAAVAARVAAEHEAAVSIPVDQPPPGPDRRALKWVKVVDVSTLALSTVALVWDACQTIAASRDDWHGRSRYEGGHPASDVIGRYPTPTMVAGYFAAAVAANAIAWWLMPDGWRSAAPLAIIAGQSVAIRRNFATSSGCNPTR